MGGHRADAGDDPVDGPVDLAAVRSDDALIDAVHGRHADALGAEDDLAEVLSAWRAEVDAVPMPELVTLDEAVAAVEAGAREQEHAVTAPPARPARSNGVRALRRLPFAVAAAASVVAVIGFSVAVHGAMPGQALWGVSKVVFTDRAASVEKAQSAQTSIDRAHAALEHNDYASARSLLDAAGQQIDGVRPQDRDDLLAEQRRLQSSLAPAVPPSPTTPLDTSSTRPGTSTTAPTTPPSTTTTTPALPAPPVPSSGSATPSTSPTTSTTLPLLGG